MRATTHVATGSAIVATIPNAWISLPLALVAHFVLDALPHYGDIKAKRAQQLAEQRIAVPIDALGGLVILLAVILAYPNSPWLVALGGVLCASPDLLQFPSFYRFMRSGDASLPNDWLSKFHDRIQWCERRWGWMVEVPFLAVMLSILLANA